MIYGRFAVEKEDLERVNALIRRVFAEEFRLTGEEDEEEFALSALVFADMEPAGAGRLLFDGARFTIAEVAVLPKYRGQAYGDFLVRLLVNRAVTAGAREIGLDALVGTEAFFEKIGFVREGTVFAKGGGRWQPMTLGAGKIPNCSACVRDSAQPPDPDGEPPAGPAGDDKYLA